MIQANELRIGNWVHHKSVWSYRQGQGENIEFDFQWNDNDWYRLGESNISLEDIEPILISEEWLLKFGFEKKKLYSWNGYDPEIIKHQCQDYVFNDEIIIRFYTQKWRHTEIEEWINEEKTEIYFHEWYERCTENEVPIYTPIKYIHQIQNIIFDLTGKELEIKL